MTKYEMFITGAAPAALILAAGVAQAQTSTSSTISTTTPGVPEAGAGGDSLGMLTILGVSALIVVAGLVYYFLQRSSV